MKSRSLILFAVLMALFGAFSVNLMAHEERAVADYEIQIGWRVEPAYTGLMNGPEVTITRKSDDSHGHDEATTEESGGQHSNESADSHADESSGVTGLQDTLQVEVSFGPATRVLNLRAVRGTPGHYVADLIPTRAGDYTFRVFGTIDGVEVDETFSAADGMFSSVEPIEDIQFP